MTTYTNIKRGSQLIVDGLVKVMNRITKFNGKDYYIDQDNIENIDNKYFGPVVDRLAYYEDKLENMKMEQEILSKELETMKMEGRTKHYTFKEKTGQKLVNSKILTVMDID